MGGFALQWRYSRPRAAATAIFSLVLQLSGFLPGSTSENRPNSCVVYMLTDDNMHISQLGYNIWGGSWLVFLAQDFHFMSLVLFPIRSRVFQFVWTNI